ncbi:MAG: cyclic 2,3-diphosphoglycerate synthase [Thermodesulfobacteriota bacterium]|nr:cyclic 2,3-diphosphoglycerate synthase [Thermodesulfobacteriota bacterium]
MERTRIVIMGAAGRDFHNFQVCYRDDYSTEVVAFTAAQIPGIENRLFPFELSGPLYPKGIPIFPEEELSRIMRNYKVQQVVFAYSDLSHVEVMHRASLAISLGADFVLLGPDRTMLKASIPVISICAIRTGCGKSGITERLWEILQERGIRAVVIRHPMPYCDLNRMRVERFAAMEDLDRYACTVEEREEYEHLVKKGIVVYAGVDYQAIMEEAQKEAQVLLWDGGNNDFSFIKPDLEIVILDPHRAGHERLYHPGEVNFLRAHVLVINKVDTARKEDVDYLINAAHQANSTAVLIQTASPIYVDGGEKIQGKRVLVIEDGPTVTHGGMPYGAGVLAAQKYGAREIVDPRPYAVGSLTSVFKQYAHLKNVLPAEGYFPEQLSDLGATIRQTPCDLVVVATPIDLSRLIPINHPTLRVNYRVEDWGEPTLERIVENFVHQKYLLAKNRRCSKVT